MRQLGTDFVDWETTPPAHHELTCPHTSPAAVPPFRTWYRGSGRTLTEKSFSGGLPPKSEPCEAFAPHGFYGLDPEVAGAITGFVAGL